VVTKKQADGTRASVSRLAYRNLVDREVVVATLSEAGKYSLEGQLHICAAPGVAACTKLLLTGEFLVSGAGSEKESRIEIDLPTLARLGLEAGNAPPVMPNK